MDSSLVERALEHALSQRKSRVDLIVHTDQGAQFVSDSYRQIIHSHRLKPSMSRRGNCWDNAVIESFFKTLKRELFYSRTTLLTFAQMKQTIHDYMHYYNYQRPHSYNDYLSPSRFELMTQVQALNIDKKHLISQ